MAPATLELNSHHSVCSNEVAKKQRVTDPLPQESIMFLDLIAIAVFATAVFALLSLAETVMERSEWILGLFTALAEDIRNLGR